MTVSFVHELYVQVMYSSGRCPVSDHFSAAVSCFSLFPRDLKFVPETIYLLLK